MFDRVLNIPLETFLIKIFVKKNQPTPSVMDFLLKK